MTSQLLQRHTALPRAQKFLCALCSLTCLGFSYHSTKFGGEHKIFSNWNIVKEAKGNQSGVARLAVERLLKNDFSLEGVNLSNTNLRLANFQKADLRSANLQKALLWYADLQEALLWYADLQEAYLSDVNLQEAGLRAVNLQKAYLSNADLQKANLLNANLQKANLSYANLQEAGLWYANLQEAVLEKANLQEAVLTGANLQEAVLAEVEKLTHKQIKTACFWEKAIYKAEWNDDKQTWIAIEPDNTNFIEELKKDKSSDPKEPVDCKI